VSKLGEEAVARYCSRAFDLPVIICRMNAAYGPNGGLPAYYLNAVVAGRSVTTRWDPCLYSPIFQEDIYAQTAALLDAARVPATIVNWAGDEPVSVWEWAPSPPSWQVRRPRSWSLSSRAPCGAWWPTTPSGIDHGTLPRRMAGRVPSHVRRPPR
jgi:hypothetical protein